MASHRSGGFLRAALAFTLLLLCLPPLLLAGQGSSGANTSSSAPQVNAVNPANAYAVLEPCSSKANNTLPPPDKNQDECTLSQTEYNNLRKNADANKGLQQNAISTGMLAWPDSLQGGAWLPLASALALTLMAIFYWAISLRSIKQQLRALRKERDNLVRQLRDLSEAPSTVSSPAPVASAPPPRVKVEEDFKRDFPGFSKNQPTHPKQQSAYSGNSSAAAHVKPDPMQPQPSLGKATQAKPTYSQPSNQPPPTHSSQPYRQQETLPRSAGPERTSSQLRPETRSEFGSTLRPSETRPAPPAVAGESYATGITSEPATCGPGPTASPQPEYTPIPEITHGKELIKTGDILADYNKAQGRGEQGEEWFKQNYRCTGLSCLNLNDYRIDPHAVLRFEQSGRGYFLAVEKGPDEYAIVPAFAKEFDAARGSLEGVFTYGQDPSPTDLLLKAALVKRRGEEWVLETPGAIGRV